MVQWEYVRVVVLWIDEETLRSRKKRQERQIDDSVVRTGWIAADAGRFFPLLDTLNKLGTLGWELIATHHDDLTTGGGAWYHPSITYLFKRPVISGGPT